MTYPWSERELVAANRADWLAARHTRVTASDAASVLGLNPFKSRAKLLREKRLPAAPDIRGGAAMRAGVFLEPGVFAWWLDDFRTTHDRRGPGLDAGGELLRNHLGTSVLVADPVHPDRLAASPDGVAWTDALDGTRTLRAVEIKTHGPRGFAKDVDGTYDDLAYQLDMRLLPEPKVADPQRCWATPAQYTQVQVQLAALGLQAGYLVRAWGNERRDTLIYACNEYAGVVRSEVLRFWEDVANG